MSMTILYSLTDDAEPDENALEKLMHEVAVEAEEKSTLADSMLRLRIKREIVEALAREGFGDS